MYLFSLDEITDIFQVNRTAIMDLVARGNMPYTRIKYTGGDIIRFDPAAISKWVLKKPKLKTGGKQYIAQYKKHLETRYPETMREIKEFGKRFHGRDKPAVDVYAVMKKYYEQSSPYLRIDAKRGRVLCENTRRIYHGFVTGQWIPYLRKNKIKSIDEIDTPLLARFQNHLLNAGLKPQTINHGISFVKKIFDRLTIDGSIKTNPCANLVSLKILESGCKIRGCYETGSLRGVFNQHWANEFLFLLILIIYTTGMRNSEIERIQVKDIITIDNYHYIDIPKSKTANGARVVPLHDFVYGKIMLFVNKTGKKAEDHIFSANGNPLGSHIYGNSNIMLGTFTGYNRVKLEQENISFYSGRHFWKTLMNSESLGEIEEYFMGHRVSGDVAKRYNHRDKQGREKFLERTAKVFAVLDQWVFGPESFS